MNMIFCETKLTKLTAGLLSVLSSKALFLKQYFFDNMTCSSALACTSEGASLLCKVKRLRKSHLPGRSLQITSVQKPSICKPDEIHLPVCQHSLESCTGQLLHVLH